MVRIIINRPQARFQMDSVKNSKRAKLHLFVNSLNKEITLRKDLSYQIVLLGVTNQAVKEDEWC